MTTQKERDSEVNKLQELAWGQSPPMTVVGVNQANHIRLCCIICQIFHSLYWLVLWPENVLMWQIDRHNIVSINYPLSTKFRMAAIGTKGWAPEPEEVSRTFVRNSGAELVFQKLFGIINHLRYHPPAPRKNLSSRSSEQLSGIINHRLAQRGRSSRVQWFDF